MKMLEHRWGRNAYVEGDDDTGRVVLGKLDGGAEEAVEVVVRGDEPRTCAERTYQRFRDHRNGKNRGIMTHERLVCEAERTREYATTRGCVKKGGRKRMEEEEAAPAAISS